MSMDMNKFESEIAENEKRRKKKYKENAELRRDWVQTLIVRGNTQWEIAESLEIGRKKELKDTLGKKLPEEYHNYLAGIDEVIRHAWKIALSGDVEKTRLEALQFVIECNKHKMAVISNPPLLKPNKTPKPLIRRHFDAYRTRNNDISVKNQKELEKNQFEN